MWSRAQRRRGDGGAGAVLLRRAPQAGRPSRPGDTDRGADAGGPGDVAQDGDSPPHGRRAGGVDAGTGRLPRQARRDGEAHDDVRRGRGAAEVGALHVRGAGPVRRPRGALVSALRASREGVVRRRLCTACSKLPAASWRRGATDCPPCAACGSWAGAVRWVEGGEHDGRTDARRGGAACGSWAGAVRWVEGGEHDGRTDAAPAARAGAGRRGGAAELDSEFVACGYPRDPDQRRATDCLRLAVEHAGILRAQVALARMRVGVSLQGGIAGRLGE